MLSGARTEREARRKIRRKEICQRRFFYIAAGLREGTQGKKPRPTRLLRAMRPGSETSKEPTGGRRYENRRRRPGDGDVWERGV